MKSFMKIGLLLGVSLCGLGLTASEKDSWPTFRGHHGDGSFRDKAFQGQNKGLVQAWKVPIGSGYTGVSIADGLAFVGFTENGKDWLGAFDSQTGATKWRFELGKEYVGHDGSASGPITTPHLAKKVIYAMSSYGRLVALAMGSGKLLWEVDLSALDGANDPFYGYGSSPILENNKLILQTNRGTGRTVAAFHTADGSLAWEAVDDESGYQSPIAADLLGKRQIVVATNNFIQGLDPNDGSILWQHRHDGKAGSSTPVPIGNDRIFMNHSRPESLMIQIKKEGDTWQASRLWTTTEIKQGLSPSVYYEGHIYGYSRSFLTCISAETGERVWKSREPGDGFLSLVDGHLVAVTKEGRLVIAPASPKGFEEKSSLALFEGPAWVPISYAEGMIFARDYEELAAVKWDEVVSQNQADVQAKMVLGPEFQGFVDQLAAAANPDEAIAAFFAKHKSFPIYEKGIAHVVYRGEAEDLAIAGDMLAAGQQAAFKKVAGSDFYYYAFPAESDMMMTYQIIRNFEQNITDPLNPITLKAGEAQFSVMVLPDYKEPLAPEVSPDLPEVSPLEFESKVMGNTRKVSILLPEGYEQSEKRFPTLYINYGDLMIERVQMPQHLIRIRAELAPFIAVFIHNAEGEGHNVATSLEFPKYVQMVAEELVPQIDQNFRTIAEPAQRTIYGARLSGITATWAGLKYPTVFGRTMSVSTFFLDNSEAMLMEAINASTAKNVHFILEWGRHDIRSPESNIHAMDQNRQIIEALKKHGFHVTWEETSTGQGWHILASRLQHNLNKVYPLASNKP